LHRTGATPSDCFRKWLSSVDCLNVVWIELGATMSRITPPFATKLDSPRGEAEGEDVK